MINSDSDENAFALHVLTVTMQSAITSQSPNPLRTAQLLHTGSHRRQRCKYRTERDQLESTVGCTCALATKSCRASASSLWQTAISKTHFVERAEMGESSEVMRWDTQYASCNVTLGVILICSALLRARYSRVVCVRYTFRSASGRNTWSV